MTGRPCRAISMSDKQKQRLHRSAYWKGEGGTRAGTGGEMKKGMRQVVIESRGEKASGVRIQDTGCCSRDEF